MDTSRLPLYESLCTLEESSLLESVKGEYDVFVSFHGEDTRNNFVCHLYEELNRKGIRTFVDDRRLEKGEPISPRLIEAIEKSKIWIVVFSPNYASSSWCLDELLKIVECMETTKRVLPVFVDVDPSDVQNQKRTFETAFKEHEHSSVRSDQIQKWRDALSKISTIVGWDSRNCFDGNQAKLIQSIAGEVSKRLNRKESSLETPLVGMDSYMKDIGEKLDLKCNDVRMLGIWGPGGIGKTTIARFIYEKYSSEDGYKACCFLRDIKDRYRQNDGAIALQKELISETLSERDSNIRNKNQGCNVISRLQSKKVFIVLDDVDEKEQLEALAEKVEWFGRGSRIIITTRNKRVLVRHGVENIFELQILKRDKALQLFSLHAFKKNEPPMNFLELSNGFISFTQCLPLALKVLGSLLYKREMDFWQDQLEKLKECLDDEIYQTLKISYDGLGEFEKKVFLDIAFFFDGEAKAKVEDILDRSRFHPKAVLPILEERALITFSFDKYLNYELIHMHDQLKLMGHKIEREECGNVLSKRRRLCDPNEIKDVLRKEMGETLIQGIHLYVDDLCEPICLEPNTFEKMNRLRILRFFNGYSKDKGKIRLSKGFGSLPKGLKYFRWDFFPLKSWPFISFGENLVELLLPESNLEYLWKGEIEFKNLKKIDLTRNESLKAFPDLSRVPNIEEIILVGCSNCYEFPSDLRHLQKLKILDFGFCNKLDKLPMLPSSLVEFFLSSNSVTELSLGFQFLTKLEILELCCTKLTLERFTEFFQCIGELKLLKKLDLSETLIVELPQTIEHLQELESLCLIACEDLVRLPSCMHRLASLQKIQISSCCSLVSLPKLPTSLKTLEAYFCESLETLECNCWNHFKQLEELSFRGCNKLDDRSRNEIMECARVMSHSYREYQCRQIEFVVPGKEIPKWFKYKSCESLITVKLPLSLHQIRGFAFCVAYTDSSLQWVIRSDLINLKSEARIDTGDDVEDEVVFWDYHFNDGEKRALTTYLGCELQFNISCYASIVKDEDRLTELKKWGVHMISDEEVNVI